MKHQPYPKILTSIPNAKSSGDWVATEKIHGANFVIGWDSSALKFGTRKKWLAGSDDHASSAGHLFSTIASAKLHGIEPERYLYELIRVLPHWPKTRYLELAPLFWKQTRARLNDAEMKVEFGDITIPEPLPLEPTPEQEALPNC